MVGLGKTWWRVTSLETVLRINREEAMVANCTTKQRSWIVGCCLCAGPSQLLLIVQTLHIVDAAVGSTVGLRITTSKYVLESA